MKKAKATKEAHAFKTYAQTYKAKAIVHNTDFDSVFEKIHSKVMIKIPKNHAEGWDRIIDSVVE